MSVDILAAKTIENVTRRWITLFNDEAMVSGQEGYQLSPASDDHFALASGS